MVADGDRDRHVDADHADVGVLLKTTGGATVAGENGGAQPKGLWQMVYSSDRWETSDGEDRHRRGLYTFWRRTSPYPSMTTFDAPSREYCVVRRVRTNTPLQALVTLNDPVYVAAAQALARRIVREAGPGTRERVAHGLRLCLARDGTPAEVERLCQLHGTELDHYRAAPEADRQAMASSEIGPLPDTMDPAELAAWTVVANVLLNLDEFLTKG